MDCLSDLRGSSHGSEMISQLPPGTLLSMKRVPALVGLPDLLLQQLSHIIAPTILAVCGGALTCLLLDF